MKRYKFQAWLGRDVGRASSPAACTSDASATAPDMCPAAGLLIQCG